jgi:plastocyanin
MSLAKGRGLGFAIVLVALALPVTPALASGGGGCGEPVTNETGTSIHIQAYCFTPTVLFAAPGDTITWTNTDPTFHNVGGANMAWGSFERMREGKSVRYSFSKPGVYSYVCTMHPGMVGTVVVGDPAPGGVTDADSIRHITKVSAVQDDTAAPEGASADPVFWLVTIATVVLFVVLAIGRAARRRTRPEPGVSPES